MNNNLQILIVACVKYCRQNGWPKTRNVLWSMYNSGKINSHQFSKIIEILLVKNLCV